MATLLSDLKKAAKWAATKAPDNNILDRNTRLNLVIGYLEAIHPGASKVLDLIYTGTTVEEQASGK